MAENKKKRGGNVKKNAPSGFYTAAEAQRVLGMNSSSFFYYVKQGKIKKYIPELRTEGFYLRKEIDALAMKLAAFLHLSEEQEEKPIREKPETRIATSEDVQGIINLFVDLGWKASPPERRKMWYADNPQIDYVVVWQNRICGYISAMPFNPEVMEQMISGAKRYNIQPGDILPYEPGNTYDVFTGIVVNTKIPGHSRLFTEPLVSGFFNFLKELAEQDIYIRRFYAHSAELPGQRIANGTGFKLQEAKEGDQFPRYMLDLETSDNWYAQQYRKHLANLKEQKSS